MLWLGPPAETWCKQPECPPASGTRWQHSHEVADQDTASVLPGRRQRCRARPARGHCRVSGRVRLRRKPESARPVGRTSSGERHCQSRQVLLQHQHQDGAWCPQPGSRHRLPRASAPAEPPPRAPSVLDAAWTAWTRRSGKCVAPSLRFRPATRLGSRPPHTGHAKVARPCPPLTGVPPA